ncbi:MAG: DUF4105 domain-containing protein [bacterium]|nr:DUF4105 domain-containing protein [bacterium]
MDTKIDSSPGPRHAKLRKWLRLALIVLVISPVLVAIGLWTTLAIYFVDVPGQNYRWICASLFALVFIAAFAFVPNRKLTVLSLLVAFAVVLVWLLTLTARHDRDWEPLAGVLPSATVNGNMVTVHNIRNFEYRSATDFTPRYYDKTFDVSKIQTLDFIISYWGGDRATAHSLLSFGFSDGEYLSVSVEARPQLGEEYTAIGGLFRKFELIYVLGHERDLIRSRTNFRNEQVFLYPTPTPPADVSTLFMEVIKRVNEIKSEPEFYNTITHNCTTNLAASGREILPPNPFDIRLLLNGYADGMAYDNGWISTEDSFEETRKRHHINQYVEGKPNVPNFSRLIRPHLRQLQ